MQRVILLDELGEKYGREHTFHGLRSPAEAIKLLCINYPEFKRDLLTSHHDGIGYRLIQQNVDMDLDEIHLPFGSQDFVLAPAVMGSGGKDGSLWKIIVGIALIAAAIYFAPALAAGGGFMGAAGTGAFSAIASHVIGNIGLYLLTTGVSEIVSPQQTDDVGNSGEYLATSGPQGVSRGADGHESYAFKGPANVVGSGRVIPVTYGKCLVGSSLVSATSIPSLVRGSDTINKYIKKPGKDTMRIGGETFHSSWDNAAGVDTRLIYDTNIKGAAQNPKKILELRDEEYVNGNNLEIKGSGKKFEIVLGLLNGLWEYAGDSDSTMVDGYITYKIDVIDDGASAIHGIIGSVTCTVQGLLKPGQEFRWAHRFGHAEGDGTGVGDYTDKLRITIIDYRATEHTVNGIKTGDTKGKVKSSSLYIQEFGYNFCYNQD